MMTARVLAFFLLLGLLSSQSAIDLFSSLSFLFVIVVLWRERRWPEGLKTFGPVFAIWFTAVAAGYVFNAAPEAPWLTGLVEFRWMFEFFVYVTLLQKAELNEKTVRVAMIPFLAAGAYSVLSYALGYHPFYQTIADREQNLSWIWRSGGLMNDAMGWSQTAGPFFCMLFGLATMALRRRGRPPGVLMLATVLMGGAVLFALTRGVWLAVAVAIPAMGFVLDRKKGLVAIGAVAAVTVLLFAFSPALRDRAAATLDFQKTHDSERLVLWRANLEIASKAPILGIGYGENKRRLREFYDDLGVPAGQFEGHAHNQYLHWLSGTGLVGLGCYLVFLFLVMRESLRGFRKHTGDWFLQGLCMGTFGAFVCFAIAGLTESNFNISKNRLAILFIAGLAVAIARRRPLAHTTEL